MFAKSQRCFSRPRQHAHPCPSLSLRGGKGYRADKRGPATLLKSWTSFGYLIMTYTMPHPAVIQFTCSGGSRPSGGQGHEVGLAPIRSPLFPTAPYWLWAAAWVCECRFRDQNTSHELSTWHSTKLLCRNCECFSLLLLLFCTFQSFHNEHSKF